MMQATLWGGAAMAVAIALIAGWRDHAQLRRRDADAVSAIDWRTVQFAAIAAAMLCAGLALNV